MEPKPLQEEAGEGGGGGGGETMGIFSEREGEA